MLAGAHEVLDGGLLVPLSGQIVQQGEADVGLCHLVLLSRGGSADAAFLQRVGEGGARRERVSPGTKSVPDRPLEGERPRIALQREGDRATR